MHPLTEALRAFAFGLPEAYEEHPWGESVAKVAGKVFVFFGMLQPDEPLRFTVKLPQSREEALSMPWSVPAGYGLDRGNWVTTSPPGDVPLDLLEGWVVESYRAVAPRRLIAALDIGM